MKLSHLNGLRALEATLRNGTFTAAAEELGVTVAAVGQQIRGLEAYLGVKLFDRRPTGAVPTEDALAVAARLTIAFTQIGEVFGELAIGHEAGRLKISMSHFILDNWLADWMPRFHKINPQIELSYHTGEEFVDLFNSDVDMAIRFSPEPGPEYSFKPLFRGCFMPVCTPQFAADFDLNNDTTDLSGVPLFQLFDATSDPAWIDWPALLANRSIVKSDNGLVQQTAGYRAALSNKGLVLCGLTESYNDLCEGRLVAPLGPKFVTEFSYGYRLVWPAGRTQSRPMRNFSEWLFEERDEFIEKASELLGTRLSKQ